MRFFSLILSSGIGLLLISCQQKPTSTYGQSPVLTQATKADTRAWLKGVLAQDPVILDARSPFDYNLAHVPSAINVRWEDFCQQNPNARGVLDPDSFALARRLALIGINPERKVLVLGKALDGQGEEGRVAWTLKYLGVKDVYVMQAEELRALRVQETPPPQNKPLWKPPVDETLSIGVARFKRLVSGDVGARPFPSKARVRALGVPAGAAGHITTDNIFDLSVQEALPKLVVIDARLPEFFAQENLAQKKNVRARVVNIPWKEFFTEKGFVSEKVTQKLGENQIAKDSVILVISNHGLASGAVTYALRALGYPRSTNFAGGYEQWNVTK